MENNLKEIINEEIIENEILNNYTQIINEECDLRTVRELRKIINSRYGILTLLNTYLYQYLISKNENAKFSNILKNIRNEQLKHLELLSDAIIKFGGVPKFNYGNNFWSSRFVNYDNLGSNIIRNNINTENRSINLLNNALKIIKNESLKSLLNELIRDKKRYIEIFTNFSNN